MLLKKDLKELLYSNIKNDINVKNTLNYLNKCLLPIKPNELTYKALKD